MNLGISWKNRRRLTAFAVVVVIIGSALLFADRAVSTGPAEGTEFIGTPTTQPKGRYLCIGTFNIDGGEGLDGKVDLDRTAKCLQHLNFIGMNEVHGFLWGYPPNQAIPLSQKLQLPFLFVPAEKRLGHETFGNAVFSDLHILHWQRIVLPSKPFKALRNYLLTDADWHGHVVHIITTHTDFKAGGAEQFAIVRDVFLHQPLPAILMGDLNTPLSNALIAKLQKTPGVEEAIGKILEPIPHRVDWIFLRGLTTVDAGQVDIKASDHPAYWAEVALK